MTKVVFSRRIKESYWENTQIYDDNPIEIVRLMKQRSNPDILMLGSGSIVQQLARESLIDEYIFIITPIVAGEGKPLFQFVEQFELNLRGAQAFESGNVVLHYLVKK
jgi:dihydrofolate reductase